jgi:MoaA/NifB/PqqE/SkfB family radical SAM enzyme
MVDIWGRQAAFAKVPYQGLLTHGEKNRTLYLNIETVNTCNNLCIICAYVDQERPKRTMSMEMFAKAVKDYIDIGGGYLSLTPSVGDIFLDKYLPQRLEFLRGIPEITRIGATTNAAMAHRFDDAELSKMLQVLTRVSISVYGTDVAEYETMTKRPTYSQMLDGMRRIVTLSDSMVQLEFRLLNAKSRHQLFEWVCREVLPDMEPDRIARKVRINGCLTEYTNWGIYNQENNPLPINTNARWAPDRGVLEDRPQCLWPLFTCLILSNGDISLCACTNYNNDPSLAMGNIMNQSLSEIYNSERAAALWNWKDHGTPEFCKSCTHHIPIDVVKERPSIVTNYYQVVGG